MNWEKASQERGRRNHINSEIIVEAFAAFLAEVPGKAAPPAPAGLVGDAK